MRWRNGETPGPWRITLFPTNRCNLKCKICWQRGAESLDWDEETSTPRLLELADEAAELGVRDWVIIGGGEPLIRADAVIPMCERIRSHDMNGVLQTNGTLLKPEISKKLIEMGWSKVNVSLDGPTKEINDLVRSEGSFDRSIENMRRLTEIKREMKSENPRLSFYTVITSANYDKIDQMVELAKSLGCDGGIELTTMVVHSEDGKPFQLTKEQLSALPKHIEKAIKLANTYSMPNNFGIYLEENIVENPNAMRKQHPRGSGKSIIDAMCFEPWLSTAITAEGVVGPCCAFWDPKAESIQKVSFRDAWLGPYLNDLRQKLIKNEKLPGYCARCPSILFAQSEVLRTRLKWETMSKTERAFYLAIKTVNSFKRFGLRRGLRRGSEWLRIYIKKR
jgi:MoaA/NifB/PqqE/SkfB family radical SAM enzyme